MQSTLKMRSEGSEESHAVYSNETSTTKFWPWNEDEMLLNAGLAENGSLNSTPALARLALHDCRVIPSISQWS